MSQNRVVQENKRDSVFPRPQTERRPFSPSSFICKELEIRTVSKDANGASTFRISSGSALLSQIHVDPIGPGTDNINTLLITLLGKKLDTGAVSKNVSGINRFRISSYIRTSEYVHRDRLLQ